MELQERLLTKDALYRTTQILMAYHSGRLDGLALDKQDVEEAFAMKGSGIVNDIFRLFDYMLETVNEPVSEELIKEYHGYLDGEAYRRVETMRSKVRGCVLPESIAHEMKSLITGYKKKRSS